MKWISVKDRLPDPELGVLAVDVDGYIHVAFRTELWDAQLKDVLEWTYYDYLPWHDVTHWMPLPDAPDVFE